FLNLVKSVRLRLLDRLLNTGRPADHNPFDLRVGAEAEMKPPLVLSRISDAAAHLLELLLTVPPDPDFGADGAAVRSRSGQFECDPIIFLDHGVAVNERRATLIRHD